MAKFCKCIEGCENYCEGSTDYCASHNLLIRKQSRESLKPKKTYQIPKVSKKMKTQLKTYSQKRKEHLNKHPDCQIKLKDICKNDRATNSIHHSAKRGSNLNKELTYLTACIPCHHHIESVMSASDRRHLRFLV